ncbi:hypothetical protein BLX24_08750 [Arsenicibacter rosenii]|uniref:DUF922 domain-containing protein n=2 Tax=Arsenicibacter rosenii TaxID=1750698 RepID=A0A1S2VME5_9BACT|nr:hypothetical protein BLX24_08750 [Arsenicibacter rosenii]
MLSFDADNVSGRKNTMKRVVWLFLMGSLQACAPQISTSVNKLYPPLAEHDVVVVFDENESYDSTLAERIGEVNVLEGSLSLGCSFDDVKNLARNQARILGANALKIYEHKYPNVLSTCHRIRAIALRFKDLAPYEKEISWHPDRLLQWKNFKGRIREASTALAETRCSIVVLPKVKAGWKIRVDPEVYTYFNAEFSWVRPEGKNNLVLQHEQLHFDIAELFARKLRKAYEGKIKDMRSWNLYGEKLYWELIKEYERFQDEYDRDIYADATRQPGWTAKVRAEMAALSRYAIN